MEQADRKGGSSSRNSFGGMVTDPTVIACPLPKRWMGQPSDGTPSSCRGGGGGGRTTHIRDQARPPKGAGEPTLNPRWILWPRDPSGIRRYGPHPESTSSRPILDGDAELSSGRKAGFGRHAARAHKAAPVVYQSANTRFDGSWPWGRNTASHYLGCFGGANPRDIAWVPGKQTFCPNLDLRGTSWPMTWYWRLQHA